MFGTLLLVGTATAFNAGVILHKLRNDRVLDALVDVSVTATMSMLYAGTMAGTAIAMVASFLFSIYLWFFPVKFPEVDMKPYMRYMTYGFVAILTVGLIATANAYGLIAVAMLI